MRGVMSFKPTLLLYCAIVFGTSNAIASDLPGYEGKWKYDAGKSSASIKSTEGVPQLFHEFIEKYGSFYPDSVTLVFTTDSFGTAHVSQDFSETQLLRIEKIEHTASHFRYKIIEHGEYENMELVIYFENDCIYIFESEWQYKSYFCKWDKNS